MNTFNKFSVRSVLCLLWVLAIFLVSSGVVRAVLGVALPAAYFSAILTTVGAIVSGYAYGFSPSLVPLPLSCFQTLFLLLGASATVLLYWVLNHHGGIVTFGNADSGLQLKRLLAFERQDPQAYHGFILFLLVVNAVKAVFHLNYYQAFSVSLHLGFVALSILSLFISIYLVVVSHVRLWLAGGVIGLCLLMGFYLPWYFQFTGQGGFSHAVSIPLFLLVAGGYSVIDSAKVRAVWLLTALCLVRFTYGLNLADLFVTAAILLTLDRPWASSGGRLGLLGRLSGLVLPVLCCVLAGYCYLKLSTEFPLGGAATKLDLRVVRIAALASVLVFCLAIVGALYERLKAVGGASGSYGVNFASAVTGEPWLRYLLFALVFSGVMFSVQFVSVLIELRPKYYIFKHTVVASAVAIAGLGYLISAACCSSSFGTGVRRTAIGSSSALVLFLFFWGYHPYFIDAYRRSHVELVSRTEWQAMEGFLAARGARLGGYFTWSWPRYMFVNAAFDNPLSDRVHFRSGEYSREPGSCVFWQARERDRQQLRIGMKIIKGSGASRLAELIAEFPCDAAGGECGLDTPPVEVAKLREAGLGYRCF